jgi:hypothetical protein
MSDFACPYISDRGDGNLCLGSAIERNEGTFARSSLRHALPITPGTHSLPKTVAARNAIRDDQNSR